MFALNREPSSQTLPCFGDFMSSFAPSEARKLGSPPAERESLIPRNLATLPVLYFTPFFNSHEFKKQKLSPRSKSQVPRPQVIDSSRSVSPQHGRPITINAPREISRTEAAAPKSSSDPPLFLETGGLWESGRAREHQQHGACVAPSPT